MRSFELQIGRIAWLRWRWLLPVLLVWLFHQMARVGFRWVDGGRLAYALALANPVDSASRLWMELVIVAGMAYAVHRAQRPGLRPALVTGLGFVALYVATFLHYRMLGTPATLDRFRDVPELLVIMPTPWMLLLCAGVLGYGVAFLWSLCLRNVLRPGLALVAALGVGWALFLVPASACAFLDRLVPPSIITPESDFYRIGSIFFAYREALRRRAIVQALSVGIPSTPRWPFADADGAVRGIKARRSIHIVLLESHTDPAWYRAVDLPPGFVDPDYRRWREASNTNGVSPVFGGGTANAEFEVLCGVPAYTLLGPVPFNAMADGAMPCLPRLLARMGYHTVASATSAPFFFNSRKAYRSIGFRETHFKDDFRMDDLDGYLLSLSSTLSQAFVFMQPHLAAGEPVLSYVVSMVGHVPFDLNPKQRPPQLAPDRVPEFAKVLDVAHYVTKEVAAYIRRLQALDPNALIVVFGDHAPPNPVEAYRDLDYLGTRARAPELELYTVPLLVLDRGEPVSVGTVPLYVIPELLVDRLSDGGYCARHACLYPRDLQVRPPHVFAKSDPLRFSCGSVGGLAAACAEANALDKELAQSFLSFMRLAN